MESTVLWGWDRFFEEMSSFIRDINRQAGRANRSYCEYAVERLEVCIENLSLLVELLRSRPSTVTQRAAHVASQYSAQLAELLSCLQGLYIEWQEYLDGRHHVMGALSYSAPVIHSAGRRGRPKFEITEEQMMYLLSMSFSWVQIAKIFGVSYMTVYRRRQEYGIPSSIGSPITDNQLREILYQLQQELPSFGQTMVWGRIRSMGFKVTRIRIRKIMRENDPIHTALRWRGELAQRQPYSVAAPNSLWHLGEYLTM